MFGQSKEGYSFPIKLLVQERRKEDGERNFIGMIQPTNLENKNGTIIINEMGIIKLVTKQTLDLFGGYHAGELLNKVRKYICVLFCIKITIRISLF